MIQAEMDAAIWAQHADTLMAFQEDEVAFPLAQIWDSKAFVIPPEACELVGSRQAATCCL